MIAILVLANIYDAEIVNKENIKTLDSIGNVIFQKNEGTFTKKVILYCEKWGSVVKFTI